MVDLMIAYANSAGDRWAAWIVAASLDAAVLLAMVGLVCDDLASTLSQVPAVEAGEAFVGPWCMSVAVVAARKEPSASSGWTRAACVLRVRRLLDTDRPIRPAPGSWSLGGLILLAAVAVPHLGASSRCPRPLPKRRRAEAPARAGQEFRTERRGSGREADPRGHRRLGADPLPTADQIHKGKLIRQQLHWVVMTTNAAGQLVIELPQAPRHFNVYITIPGYGPSSTRRTARPLGRTGGSCSSE